MIKLHGLITPTEVDTIQGGYNVNGVAQTISFIICGNNEWFNTLMNKLQQETYSDYIVACFTVPKLAVSDFMISDNAYDPLQTNIPVYILKNPKTYTQNPTSKTLVSTPSNLDGYVPKNQKLRTYPYLYVGFNPPNRKFKNL